MKKTIVAMLSVFALMSAQPVLAEDPNVFINQDNIRYKIWTSRGTAEIVYKIGDLPDDLFLSDSIEYMGQNYCITQINERGFKGSNFKTIRLPGSLKTISNSAFEGCSQMQEIGLPESVQYIGERVFCECSSLTKILIPKNVHHIGYNSFFRTQISWVFNASALDLEAMNKDIWNSPDFPYDARFVKADSLGTFNDFEYYVSEDNRYIYQMEPREHLDLPLGYRLYPGLLEDYPTLTSITVPEGTTELPFGIFAHSEHLQRVDLPSTLLKIGNKAFYDCVSLKSIDLPSSVVTIGEGAFQQCEALEEIVLPPLVTRLEPETFANCFQLHTVGRLEEMEAIGESAFQQCESLKSVSLPRITRIEAMTFLYSGLEEIHFSDSLSYIGNSALSCCKFTSLVVPATIKTLGKSVFYWCKDLASVTLPEGLTELPQSLFAGCYALSQLNIPESVTTIGQSALSSTSIQSLELHDGITLEDAVFENCQKLKHIKLPASLSYLPHKTFQDCTALDSLCLGSHVATIGDNVVSGCTSLAYISCDAAEPPVATSKSFAKFDTYRCEVRVPDEAVEAYKTARGWRTFSHWNTAWSPDEPEPQYEELYHVYWHSHPNEGPDFYIATHNIGAQTGDEVGTRFASITNDEVEDLFGTGWRLMTPDEASFILWDFHSEDLQRFFPITYTEDYYYNEGADPSHIRAAEYWIEGGGVLFWGLYWGNRQQEHYEREMLQSPHYQSELPVRPVRDDLPLGISVMREPPHTVAVYDLNGRRNATANGLRIEVLNNGKVRKTIIRD